LLGVAVDRPQQRVDIDETSHHRAGQQICAGGKRRQVLAHH
jgi:hypothetical protein